MRLTTAVVCNGVQRALRSVHGWQFLGTTSTCPDHPRVSLEWAFVHPSTGEKEVTSSVSSVFGSIVHSQQHTRRTPCRKLSTCQILASIAVNAATRVYALSGMSMRNVDTCSAGSCREHDPTTQSLPRARLSIAHGSMFFLSGVMVGSGAGETTAAGVRMVPQDYRTVLREALLKEDPAAVVVDPLELGEQRATEWFPAGTVPWESNDDVRRMLNEVVAAAAAADVVISYLPSASMGSALELQAAFNAGKTILAVVPGIMSANWVVRAHATAVFDDVDALMDAVRAALVHTTEPSAPGAT